MLSLSSPAIAVLSLLSVTSATILQNGQVRLTDYPDTRVDPSAESFTTYRAGASEISYKGRWDSKHVSWWSSPGIRFGYTGQTVAISFGNLTSDGVLVGYRIGGLDWMFANITAGATHLLIDAIHVAKGEKLVKLPDFERRIEVIGDSLAAGMYTTYERLSSWAYGLGAGLGNTEYSVTAYPGICAADQDCFDNPRGQVHQWFYTSDTGGRALEIYGDSPEPLDFSKHPAADLVVINIGTNDNNAANNVSTDAYIDALTKIIEVVHGKWPNAQVIVMSLWLGFYQYGNSYLPNAPQGWVTEIYQLVQWFNSDAYLRNPIIYDGVTQRTAKTGRQADQALRALLQRHGDYAAQRHRAAVASNRRWRRQGGQPLAAVHSSSV